MSAPTLLDHSRLAAKPKIDMIQVDKRVQIRSAYWAGGARGLVHIFQGRAEYIEKYQDVISAFLTRGFDVVVHDWRDQGLSTRNPHKPLRNIVKNFNAYNADAKALIAHYAHIEKPRILFAHSMGGAIGLKLLNTHPKTFQGAIFSSPLWDFSLPKTAYPFRWLITLAGLCVKPYGTTPGTGDYRYELVNSFEDNSFTNSRENWDWIVNLSKTHPEILKFGPTYAWTWAALVRIAQLKRLPPITTPTLVSMGEKDRVVSIKRIHQIANKHKAMRLVSFTQGRHQDYIETPDIQQKLWQEIDAHIKDCGL